MTADKMTPARPTEARLPITPAMSALAWGLLSLLGFILSGNALIWPVGQLEGLIGLPHVAALGFWALVCVLGGGLMALGSARLIFVMWPRVGVANWLILLVGGAVSAAQIAIQASWTMARFGYNDPELVGPTYLLFLVVAGVAVAGLGVRVAPRTAVWAPLIAVFGGVGIAIAFMLSNIHGLTDGLAPDSRLLLGAMAVSLGYIALVGILSIVRLLRGA